MYNHDVLEKAYAFRKGARHLEIRIEKKYLLLPINGQAARKRLCFYENGKLLFDIDCRLDMLHPTFTGYLDVERWIGKTVLLETDPEMAFTLTGADTMNLPNLWHEPFRPQLHFTVPSGYHNDPNGLIYCQGLYHLFYQYNPCSPVASGNQHWGHAVSRDLLHWEMREPALYPDETGAMFSGSAIEDSRNRTGLAENDGSPLLLFYTAAGDHTLLSQQKTGVRTQCMAYSVDGGIHFEKWNGNPVVPHITGKNRDPKVVWVDEIGKYVMALFLTGSAYRLLVSEDLLHWETMTDLCIPGEKECPDLYCLMCDGERKWILSGASDRYLVGHFDASGFVADQEVQQLTYSRWIYAAQSFSGMPDGTVLRIAWNKNRTQHLDHRFSQQMSFPMQMSLEQAHGRYWLSAQPFEGIQTLWRKTDAVEHCTLQAPVRFHPTEGPLDLTLQIPYIPDARIALRIFGAQLLLDTAENLLYAETQHMPLSVCRDRIDLRVLVDTGTVEVFADGGRFCLTEWIVSDFNLPEVELSADTAVFVDRFVCRSLEPVHARVPHAESELPCSVSFRKSD